MMNVSTVNFRENFSKYMDDVSNHQQTYIVGAGAECAVFLSEKRFRELEKAERNAAYLQRLDESFEQLRAGNVVVKTMDELRALEADE